MTERTVDDWRAGPMRVRGDLRRPSASLPTAPSMIDDLQVTHDQMLDIVNLMIAQARSR